MAEGGTYGACGEDDKENWIDDTVRDSYQLAGGQRGGQRVPIVGVDSDEVDGEERRETDEEPDRDDHGRLDDAQFGREYHSSRHADAHLLGRRAIVRWALIATMSSAKTAEPGPDLAGGWPGAQLTWGH